MLASGVLKYLLYDVPIGFIVALYPSLNVVLGNDLGTLGGKVASLSPRFQGGGYLECTDKQLRRRRTAHILGGAGARYAAVRRLHAAEHLVHRAFA